jgi:ADP-heptose:LPS heptosyltransferase
MQGNGTLINQFMLLLDARKTAGFYTEGDYCPDPDYFLEYPVGIHECEKHLRLMKHLGVEEKGAHLEFPIYPADRQDLERLGLPIQPGSYVCIHPGSRGAWRQWPPAYFALLADECAAAGLQVVITGTKDEKEIADSVAEKMVYSAFNIAGETSLGAVACLIDNAALLISNCTGVAHIASALHTESVVISMDGEPERWGAIDKSIHYTADWVQHPDFEMVRAATSSIIQRVANSLNVI